MRLFTKPFIYNYNIGNLCVTTDGTYYTYGFTCGTHISAGKSATSIGEATESAEKSFIQYCIDNHLQGSIKDIRTTMFTERGFSEQTIIPELTRTIHSKPIRISSNNIIQEYISPQDEILKEMNKLSEWEDSER